MSNRRTLMIGGAVGMMVLVVAIGVVLFGSGSDTNDTATDTPEAVADSGAADGNDSIAAPTSTLARQPTLTPIADAPEGTPGPTPTPLPFAITAEPLPTPYNVALVNDVRLDIPKLDFIRPIPIVELPVTGNTWNVTNLGYNIGWLDQTTWLESDWGNTVLVAHVNLSETDEGPFYNLFQVEPGDEVIIYQDDEPTTFIVYEIDRVPADAIEETYPTTYPMLTLMTCTNWDESRGVFSDRRIIRAYPAETDELPDSIDPLPEQSG